MQGNEKRIIYDMVYAIPITPNVCLGKVNPKFTEALNDIPANFFPENTKRHGCSAQNLRGGMQQQSACRVQENHTFAWGDMASSRGRVPKIIPMQAEGGLRWSYQCHSSIQGQRHAHSVRQCKRRSPHLPRGNAVYGPRGRGTRSNGPR